MDDLIEALTIFRRYANPEYPTNCTHGELTIMEVGRVTAPDAARLEELGFDWDGECWTSFRFGSA